MKPPLRFGIIGCGVVGNAHAEAIGSLPDARLVAVADVDRTRAHALADRYRAHAYVDLNDMLDDEDLDVVTVSTASGMHGEHACAVMRSGRHAIVEKPMEIRRAAIDEMLSVQAEAGVQLAVIFQHRLDASSQRLRALVDQKAFGKIVLGNAHVVWWRSQAYYDSGAWRGTWNLDGGGVLMNQGIHAIDLLQWLMGPVHSVYACADTLVHRMETEDVAVAAIRFRSGALGTIVGTTAAYPGVTTRIEIFGNHGSAVIERDQLAYLHLGGEEREAVGPYGLETSEQEMNLDLSAATATHATSIADVIRAIREGGEPLVDGRSARHSVEIVLAVYESVRTGKEIVLR